MAATLGKLLLDARAQKGCSLADAARFTKIPEKYLQALESDALAQLPEPVFVRGYLRNYSRFLGIDSALALQLYLDVASEAPQDNNTILIDSVKIAKAAIVVDEEDTLNFKDKSSVIVRLVKFLLVLALIAILLLGGYWVAQSFIPQLPSLPWATKTSNLQPASVVVPPTVDADPLQVGAAQTTPSVTEAPTLASPPAVAPTIPAAPPAVGVATIDKNVSTTPVAVTTPAEMLSTQQSAQQQATHTSAPVQTVPVVQKPTTSAPPVAVPAIKAMLKVSFTAPNALTVLDDAGNVVHEGAHIAGEVLSVQAKPPLTIRLLHSNDVSAVLNNEPITFPQGNESVQLKVAP